MNKPAPLVAILLSLLTLSAIFMPQQMLSPGALINAHNRLESDCFACHTPFAGSVAENCMVCHLAQEIGIKTTQGVPLERGDEHVAFHQQLLEADCIACHSDHRGVKNFRPDNPFSHALLEPATQQQCSSCHRKPEDNLHSTIEKRCSECHTVDEWRPAAFDHDTYFRFDRYHDATCETCHEESNYTQYSCYGCHEHSEWNVRGEHLEEGIMEYEICVACHRSGDEDEAEWLWRQKRYKEHGIEGNRQRYRYEHDDEDD